MCLPYLKHDHMYYFGICWRVFHAVLLYNVDIIQIDMFELCDQIVYVTPLICRIFSISGFLLHHLFLLLLSSFSFLLFLLFPPLLPVLFFFFSFFLFLFSSSSSSSSSFPFFFFVLLLDFFIFLCNERLDVG